jgi:hypothetical protein
MCRESLVSYLYSKTDEEIPHQDLETLIFKGSQIIRNEITVIEKGKETDTYQFKLPKRIRLRAEDLDKALANIRVCDPAVNAGSKVTHLAG